MNSSISNQNRIDIFCRVIDNYGDIGVCWRLARIFAQDYGYEVRLFVDDLAALEMLQPGVCGGVTVLCWDERLVYLTPAAVVIEAFACTLPDQVLEQIAVHKPVWIDLEYLTAEDWAASCHAIPSLNPAVKVKKSLFFPGFDTRTGGLLVEKDYVAGRNAFQASRSIQDAWRARWGMPPCDTGVTDISLFSYKTAPNQALLDGLAQGNRAVRVFIPAGGGAARLEQRGALSIYYLPFFPQKEYDKFLWTCDLNFVRGEDSFVRAQLAGKPWIWNIYVQEEGAHQVKLGAFLERVKSYYAPESWERLVFLHKLWNEDAQNSGMIGSELLHSLAGLRSGAEKWADYLASQSNLTDRLLAFVQSQRNV